VDKQTDQQTDGLENATHATDIVGVGYDVSARDGNKLAVFCSSIYLLLMTIASIHNERRRQRERFHNFRCRRQRED